MNLAANCAMELVRAMGPAMSRAWNGELAEKDLHDLALSFYIHPEHIRPGASPEHLVRIRKLIQDWAQAPTNQAAINRLASATWIEEQGKRFERHYQYLRDLSEKYAGKAKEAEKFLIPKTEPVRKDDKTFMERFQGMADSIHAPDINDIANKGRAAIKQINEALEAAAAKSKSAWEKAKEVGKYTCENFKLIKNTLSEQYHKVNSWQNLENLYNELKAKLGEQDIVKWEKESVTATIEAIKRFFTNAPEREKIYLPLKNRVRENLGEISARVSGIKAGEYRAEADQAVREQIARGKTAVSDYKDSFGDYEQKMQEIADQTAEAVDQYLDRCNQAVSDFKQACAGLTRPEKQQVYNELKGDFDNWATDTYNQYGAKAVKAVEDIKQKLKQIVSAGE